MLNTTKLLYLFPDVAYLAEVLPSKKAHEFSIQSFKQINGEFMDDNELIAENVAKLAGKLEAEDYTLILPDFLFTNTIIEVNEKSESGIKKHLEEELFPKLELSKDSHEIDFEILNEHAGKTRVQV